MIWGRIGTAEERIVIYQNFKTGNGRVANGDAVSYKVDGERFEGGSRTLKFATNTRYKITLTSKPPAEFQFATQGPGGLLKRHLQSKFYQKDDSHADWGHKLESIQWTCAVDDAGNISVTEEQIK
ncbi:unnamed protein product [Nippostrongylus brasiliensis]|uniref:CB1 cannabinoid receptor-interacting protein 1 n=1 Tax=Nippostrongylus brasiliensis TaxID=27835 RepID=A0A0N4YUM4_NIPBR|nr:unnamed protein product [Nippostrongylus brasiliensis]